MTNSITPDELLLNDFVTRSFRDMADRDYIAARLSYRAQLVPQFLWQSLQAVEKYLKCILVYNRVKAEKSHDILSLLASFQQANKFDLSLSDETLAFLRYLNEYGRHRYFEIPYFTRGKELMQLDRAIWEIRRYARYMNYSVNLATGKSINILESELARNVAAEKEAPQRFRIIGGYLEKVIEKRKHANREPLVWHNLYFGTIARRKLRPHSTYWVAENPTLSRFPQILDEVLKYVYIPKDVANEYRALLAANQSVP